MLSPSATTNGESCVYGRSAQNGIAQAFLPALACKEELDRHPFVFELGQQFFLSPFTKVSHQFVIKVEMVLNRGLAFACDEKDLPYVIGFQFLDHVLDHRLFSHRKHFFGL